MGRGPSIEGRKGAEDAKRGQLFTKLIREVSIAVKTGGTDPATNPRLRVAMDKALDANMSKDTLERAIKRGAGGEGSDSHEARYEGYGVGGIAVVVDAITDNPNRLVAEVRHAFGKFGGNMGTSGSVAFQFTRCGQISFDTRNDVALEEKILELALELGADDVQSDDGLTEVITSPDSFSEILAALKKAGLEPFQADITLRPNVWTEVTAEQAESLRKMLDKLESLDDVQDVFHNAVL
jgi:YebC/PmpR family DNA-binding regulatory protein